MDFEAGDVGYALKMLSHYAENTGNTNLRFLEMFKIGFFSNPSLRMALAHAPELVLRI